ncbi:MAG: molybdopterin molybdotransferase MoeA [Alphaproteobacteria bacterium]|nr:molybdopterin molybdotransferase MoeA [Alphaproteobacteria bacterium]HPF45744.1 molybdopterin molybdotransferase MoeA [Emcibacteraceae bacterium]HRW29089.1 molybdopterin molybdotransferase MoeA [Emcibacteraceae bacterium]
MSLLPVPDALAIILNSVKTLPAEKISLHEALGRVVAEDIRSNLTQPPFAASAMDGYAIRFADCADPINVIGESKAGERFVGRIGPGEAVRIFTGAPMVDGADTVVIQENVRRHGDRITVNECKAPGANIRAAGGDFKTGDCLIKANTIIGARQIALLAAGNVAELMVYKKPKVAILSTGDELMEVGSEISPDKIVNSNVPMLMALVAENGGEPVNLGTAKDTIEDVRAKIAQVKDVDMFVSIGGVSVGDYDLIQTVLKDAGLKVAFWKVAMQPGKPLVYGDFNSIPYFGMPGNPASAFVCFVNFMLPALQKMQGKRSDGHQFSHARIEHELDAGGSRQNYMRANYHENERGEKWVSVQKSQGSANLYPLAHSNCLLVREIDAPAAEIGDLVRILLLE